MQKVQCLSDVTTLGDVKLLLEAPKPHFDGAKWYVGKYTVPEEELMVWSLTSMIEPLNSDACKRFESLFEQIYGINPDDL